MTEVLLPAWNDTFTEFDGPAYIHQLISRQAQRTPHHTALRHHHTTLTYEQLEHQANQLAHTLTQHGAKPETRIAICLERSPDLIIALLAILKTGAAYVPLDPSYPPDRLHYMLTDSNATILLTHQQHLHQLHTSATTITLDTTTHHHQPTTTTHPPLHPHNLAYVIYTSGSTGTPKGSMNTHRNIVNFLNTLQRTYRMEPDDVVLQRTPSSFDVSVWEFFWPLTVGASLTLARPRGDQDPAYLSWLVDEHHVTTVHFVPSSLGPFLDSRAPGSSTSLRRVMCSGEALSTHLRDRVLTELPHVELHNLYGPTEAAVDVTAWHCTAADGETVPIGTQLHNSYLRVLDESLGPTPIGVAGELHIGGVQVSRGYLDRPDLTAERFIPDGEGEPGSVLYRTGDIARWRGDGVLEYLGRRDHQVKVRGFRVETTEIEAALLRLDTVRDAAVIALAAGTEEARLVAYVVAAQPTVPIVTAEIRARLARVLPDYMVPSFVVVLDRLPQTPNDKLDRRALPPPRFDRTLTTPLVAPSSATEIAVVEIWREVLGVTEVGVHDDFFALGGQSLLAARMVHRCREAFKIELTVGHFFARPTVAGLATRIDAAPSVEHRILRRDLIVEVPGPLSAEQTALWFLQQLDPDNPSYNVCHAVTIDGPVEPVWLGRALTGLVRRHAILRTRYESVDGMPAQRILPAAEVDLVVRDLRGLGEYERAEAAAAEQARQARLPCDLAAGPMLRAVLLRHSDERAVLVLTMPHIACDEAAITILLDELTELDEPAEQDYADDRAALHYRDYAAWQAEQSTSDDAAAFWRTALAGAATSIELPTKGVRPPMPSYRGATHTVSLPAEVTALLRDFAAENRASMFMTTLAAFQVLLARFSGQLDFLVGAPVSGRDRPELAGVVGCFLNTLPLRARLSPEMTFRECVADARATAVDAFRHQAVPLARIVELADPPRDPDRNPLFQVMFVYQQARPVRRTGALTLRDSVVHNGGSKVDLTLFVEETETGLSCTFEYATDLFTAEAIGRLAGSFTSLVAALLQAADRPLATVESDDPSTGWNDTFTEFDGPAYIHQLISRQAQRTPHHTALRHHHTTLTYEQLEHQANQLAHTLTQHGAKPETRIAICLERSPDLIIALLAILKTGAAYVPLDPSYPPDRLHYMLTDSNATILLTHQQHLHQLHTTATTITLDSTTHHHQPTTTPHPPLHPHNLAYVIYTSGSTGTPKGSMNTHRNLTNLIRSFQRYPGFTAEDRMLSVTTVSFDIAGLEFFLPLTVGAELCLADADEVIDPQRLAARIAADRPTVLQATPTSWRMLVESDWEGQPVLSAWVGGEPLPASLTLRLAELGVPAWNVYGPTETTIWSTCGPVEPGPINVGGPIANTVIRVLDAFGGPTPIGVVGNVAIAGDGVARGYHDRAELTAERFVPDPAATAPGGRMYLTGDRGRWNEHGRLEILGRTDDQVKVRGVRIELGEVENALGRHADVAMAVAAVSAQGDDVELVGYLVPRVHGAGNSLAAEVKALAVRELPTHYVPTRFVMIDKVPRTPNGKVDRRALAALRPAAPEHAQAATPTHGLEQVISGIWCELLGVPSVGVHENFFEIGGHSMLLARLHHRLQATFPWQGTVADLFQYPTVRSQFLAISGDEATAKPSDAAPPSDAGRDRLRRRMSAGRPS
ncbi:amino acid adenylation domain-containing protein [Nonomuraea sp. K274]|uniref:Amino acid adenylation domain-containing protein n=1 Tax=Nonomuraea cypriaca TaxID=1187855 RepID=A0A931A6B9_9ACTN|nr:non-ribosomal peptide synthetase [Nonomuraea cypriaca]MBF8187051.1 amino acid adenylation domain-containing protein [Nonomuraea cypriaca]